MFVRQIYQVNNDSFAIEWDDSTLPDLFTLSELQELCPCRRCIASDRLPSKEQVGARRIVSVGMYALRVEFTSGCSEGIYTFRFLRELANKRNGVRNRTDDL